MGSFSTMHWLVVLGVVVLVFGTGKLPKALGDLARGVKTFKNEMGKPDDETTGEQPAPKA